MPSKIFVSGMLMVMMISILVLAVEFFIPLSVKADMNTLCRNTLLKMEAEGGLSDEEMLALESKLEERGLEEVRITGTAHAKKGQRLSLRVDAGFRHSMLSALFVRTEATQRMCYERVSMSRRAVN